MATQTQSESQTSVTPTPEHKEFHPIAEVFPRLSDGELETLANDIKENGLRHPIITFQNKIVDGKNRYLACEIVGFDPRYEEFKGKESDLPRFVTSLNINRRHMTAVQRAMAAAEMRTLIGTTGGRGPLGAVTKEEAACYLRTSRVSVERASHVLQYGIPALVDGVKAGKFSLEPSSIVAKLPPGEQARLVKDGNWAIGKRAKQLNGKAAAAVAAPEPEVEPEPIGIFAGGSDQEQMDEFTAALNSGDQAYIEERQERIASSIREIAVRASAVVEACPSILAAVVDSSGHLSLTEASDG